MLLVVGAIKLSYGLQNENHNTIVVPTVIPLKKRRIIRSEIAKDTPNQI